MHAGNGPAGRHDESPDDVAVHSHSGAAVWALATQGAALRLLAPWIAPGRSHRRRRCRSCRASASGQQQQREWGQRLGQREGRHADEKGRVRGLAACSCMVLCLSTASTSICRSHSLNLLSLSLAGNHLCKMIMLSRLSDAATRVIMSCDQMPGQ